MLYDRIDVISLTPEMHARTCGYWYLVQSRCTPHTAFAEEAHLLAWLAARGLTLAQPLPAKGEYSCQRASGSYRTEMHGSYDAFFALDGERVRVLSNGQYTLGIITKDDDDVRTEHFLNVNCRDRPTFDYAESRALFG
jgi:hypothetical protein